MKIVGLTYSGYLVELSHAELDVLAAEHVDHSRRERQIERKLTINETWGALGKLKRNVNELTSMAGQLRCVADLLQPIACAVDTLTKPDPKENPDADF
jgi:hypothetical protein